MWALHTTIHLTIFTPRPLKSQARWHYKMLGWQFTESLQREAMWVIEILRAFMITSNFYYFHVVSRSLLLCSSSRLLARYHSWILHWISLHCRRRHLPSLTKMSNRRPKRIPSQPQHAIITSALTTMMTTMIKKKMTCRLHGDNPNKASPLVLPKDAPLQSCVPPLLRWSASQNSDTPPSPLTITSHQQMGEANR